MTERAHRKTWVVGGKRLRMVSADAGKTAKEKPTISIDDTVVLSVDDAIQLNQTIASAIRWLEGE